MESPHNSNPEWSWDTRLIEVLQVDEDVGNLFMGKAQYNYSTLRSWADAKNLQAKERILRLSFRDIQRHNSNFKNGVKKDLFEDCIGALDSAVHSLQGMCVSSVILTICDTYFC